MKHFIRRKVFVLLLVFIFVFSSVGFAHSGRTDSSGGHKDNQNKSGLGSYHYHHGYGPHLHPNGVCPYSTTSSSNSSTSSPSTSKISYSSEVKTYQYKLNELNYNCGKPDGYLGPNTQSSINSFQSENNLTKSGKFDLNTRLKIDELYKQLSSSSNSQTTTEVVYTLNHKIQTKLKKLGYYTGVVDGSLGPISIKAIKAFQKDNYLEVDGICGPLTLKKWLF